MPPTQPLKFNRSIPPPPDIKLTQFDPSTGYPLENGQLESYYDSYGIESVHFQHDNNLGSSSNQRSRQHSQSQMDSIFDAYGEYGNESGGEEEEQQQHHHHNQQNQHHQDDYEDDDRSIYSPEVEVVQPWDSRGKNGLYGGGGRGGNDRETGWVQDYETTRSNSIWSQGSERNESRDNLNHEENYSRNSRQDLNRRRSEEFTSEVPQFSGGALHLLNDDHSSKSPLHHGRHSSSSTTDQSSYGPDTPIGSTTIASKEFSAHHSVSVGKSLHNRINSVELQTYYEPTTLEPVKSNQDRQISNQQQFPRRPSRNIPPPLLPPLEFSPLASNNSGLPYQSSNQFESQSQRSPKPQTSPIPPKSYLSPKPLSYLLPALSINEPSLTRPPKPDNLEILRKPSIVAVPKLQPPTPSTVKVTPENSSSSSSSSSSKKVPTFRRRLSKTRLPKISSPILPDGFVESLGMTTFALDLKNPEKNKQPIKAATSSTLKDSTLLNPIQTSSETYNSSSTSNTSSRLPSPLYDNNKVSPRVEQFGFTNSPVSSTGGNYSDQRQNVETPESFREDFRRQSSGYTMHTPNRTHSKNQPKTHSRGENFSNQDFYTPAVGDSRYPLPSTPWSGSNNSTSNNRNNSDPTSQQQQQSSTKNNLSKPAITPSPSTPALSGFRDPWMPPPPQTRKQSIARPIPPPITIPTNSYRQDQYPSINSAPTPNDYHREQNSSHNNYNGNSDSIRPQSAAVTKTQFKSDRYDSPDSYESSPQSYQQSQSQYQKPQQSQQQYYQNQPQSNSNNRQISPPNSAYSTTGRYEPNGNNNNNNNDGRERSSLANRPSHHYRKSSTLSGGSGGGGVGSSGGRAGGNVGNTGSGNDSGKWGSEAPPRRKPGEEQWVSSWQ